MSSVQSANLRLLTPSTHRPHPTRRCANRITRVHAFRHASTPFRIEPTVPLHFDTLVRTPVADLQSPSSKSNLRVSLYAACCNCAPVA